MHSRILAAAVAALGVMAIAAPTQRAAGQGSSVSERDALEVKNYRLTMDKMRKLAAAGEAMMKAMESDPRYKAEQSLKTEIAALEKKDELTPAEEKRLDELRTKLEEQEAKADKDSDASNAQSLDDMAKKIESVPAMASAIRGAGLSPREYSVLSLATFQAMMVHGMQKQYGSKDLPKEYKGTVIEENIKFVADNEAEINQLLERMKALEKKRG